MKTILVVAGLSLGAALQSPIATRQLPSDVESFISAARIGSERYHDRANAIMDGYRLVGGDFPGMGEHWINVAAVMRGAPLEPGAPQMLSYAFVNGEPVLVGVGYALAVGEGELAPQFPSGVSAWHEHSHSIEDETLETHSLMPGATHHTRLAVMHAWVWMPNPEGLFERNNWSLPFARLGLTAPTAVQRDAAQALSLLTHGDGYYAGRLERGHRSATGGSDYQALTEAIEAVHRMVDTDRPDELDADRLAAIWRALCRGASRVCPEP